MAVVTWMALGYANMAWSQEKFEAPKGKEVYIPADLKENDFTKEDSKWSFARCAYTDDVIVFWEKPFGKDLSKAPTWRGTT